MKVPPLAILLSATLSAAPQWKTPPELKLGQVETLLLVDEDPSAKPLLRPQVDERLGTLRVRSLEPAAEGRGWRFQVQALEPGMVVVAPLDLGDGRRAPELRLKVPRTTPFGAPWMGWGGGREDQLPAIPFPWGWAAAAMSPLVLLVLLFVRLWRHGAPGRRRIQARHAFAKAWPPKGGRETLDLAHGAGRGLLAAHWGSDALAWGPEDFQRRGLDPWSQWLRSLDAARFGRTTPPFPALETLLANLDARPPGAR